MKPKRGRPRGSEITKTLEAEALRLREEMERFERYERERLEVEFEKSMKPVRAAYLDGVRKYLHAGGTNAGLGRIIDTRNYYQQQQLRNEVMQTGAVKPIGGESRIVDSIREVSFPRVARPHDPRVVYEDAGTLHEIVPVGDELWLLDGEEVEYARVSTIVEAARTRNTINQQKGEGQ